MRAVVVDHDAPGHVALKEVPEPVPTLHQAVVKVSAVSLNLGEIRYAQSKDPGSPMGWDLAGTVESAAEDGAGPAVGTRVVGFLPTAAWAEYAAVPVNALAALPDEVTFAQAATLPVAGLTALYVIEKGRGLINRRVLITGANGGVGLFACQIAKLAGAHVVALIRREQYTDLVREAAADTVVVNEDGSGAAEHGPYRLIADAIAGAVLPNILTMLDHDGICVTYGASASPEVTLNIWPLVRAGRAMLYGFLLFNEVDREPASEGLSRLARMLSEGHMRTFITVEQPWERIGEVAHDLWERKITGKAVLHVA